MHYAIDPGLYALGMPDRTAPVLVTANYKMSFDRLREALPGRDAWIIVLDTDGINVWCAAGKGTFGTAELVKRLMTTGISRIVTHRTIILPQLAGPGVAAHLVKKYSGFNVTFGPVRAADLPAYLDTGCRATPAMRTKTFPLVERMSLIPIELVEAFKTSLFILPVVFLLGGVGGPGGYWANAARYGLFAAIALLSAVAAGTVLTPILLPVLPGRAFALKGLWLGVGTAAVLTVFRAPNMAMLSDRLEIIAWLLLVPAITSYLAMNFTGASTYTSLSGVKKEMRVALPLEITTAVVGLAVWLGSRFTA